MPALHDDELAIDDRLVARLVACSLPRHAGLRVRALPSSGSSDALCGALDVWDQALAAESTSAPPRTWCHGDLLAENLLVRDGRLAAALDFGGLAVGDPAVDLMVAWEVLDRPGRRAFRQAVGAGDAAWAKGRGWALLVAMITFPYYWRTMPARCSARRSMAAAVLAEG